MTKDRLISETCDFGVVYSLYLRTAGRLESRPSVRRAVVKISWDETLPSRELETRSCVYELDLEQGILNAMGRKGNQLPAERFSAEKICAWARRELAEYEE